MNKDYGWAYTQIKEDKKVIRLDDSWNDIYMFLDVDTDGTKEIRFKNRETNVCSDYKLLLEDVDANDYIIYKERSKKDVYRDKIIEWCDRNNCKFVESDDKKDVSIVYNLHPRIMTMGDEKYIIMWNFLKNETEEFFIKIVRVIKEGADLERKALGLADQVVKVQFARELGEIYLNIKG